MVHRDPSTEGLEATKERKDAPAASREKRKVQKPWIIDRLQFKMDEIGYLDRRRTHLYAFDLAAKTLLQVTSGDFDDSEPAWSPDGRRIAFSSNRSRPDPDATYDTNIWVVRADNQDQAAHVTQITSNPGADASPSWSPDGKSIPYVTQLDPHLLDYATRPVAAPPATGGSAKVVTLALDRNAEQPRFSSDGKIFFIADDDGALRLYRSTELVVYPGEYHEFKAPSHIKNRLGRYLAWYNHYVKADAAPARPESR